jgi:putative OPT family oligopeptide transporter
MSNSKLPVDAPLIPAQEKMPEITLKALCIGTILTIVLAAANAYLGLKVGQTISASIPAAIISMSVLRFFRHSNVLENTMVQTMASVGEALISGITFIIPALVILHAWDKFYYWQTVAIALLGGILGVLFTIPLRRALLTDRSLHYPEGTAISNVFKASTSKDKNDIRQLTIGGTIGGVISLFQTGFQILSDHLYFWVKTSTTVFGFGVGLSPALIAAGYIVGINASLSILAGIIIGWVIGIPCLTWFFGMPHFDSATDIAMTIWRTHVRNIGVGTMLVGGIWTLVTLCKPIASSLCASFHSLRNRKSKQIAEIRTERDIPINYVLWAILLLLIPSFLFVIGSIIPANAGISTHLRLILGILSVLYLLIGGFIFCSIAAYFAGLIGSSNTPISGLMVSSVLILCLLLLMIFSAHGGISGKDLIGVLLSIGCTIILGGGVAIANDTMQDLKVGQVVGATPWKQQVMLILGVVVTAFVMPPILNLLYNAYGIGGVFPHPGMDKAQMLAAPQAGLMATIAQGVFAQNLEWLTIGIGAVIAIFCIIIDEIMKRYGARLPVLAIGIGIYLPLEASVPVVVGGLLAYFVQLKLNKRYRTRQLQNEAKIATHRHRGLLLACGIVAGASVMGVILAIPFTLTQSSNALKIMPEQLRSLTGILGLLVTFFLCAWIYKVVMKDT